MGRCGKMGIRDGQGWAGIAGVGTGGQRWAGWTEWADVCRGVQRRAEVGRNV